MYHGHAGSVNIGTRSCVPGLVKVDTEEGWRWAWGGEVVFVAQVKDAQLASGADPPPPNQWAPGRYWACVYEAGRKAAEVQFEVTP